MFYMIIVFFIKLYDNSFGISWIVGLGSIECTNV